jgi:probable phosphoglycerate mutase
MYDIVGSEGRFCGRSNPSLNARGIEEAITIAQLFKCATIDRLYSSPLARSIETAEHIAQECKIDVVTDPLLSEIDYGIWDGLSKGEISSKYAEEYERFSENPFLWHPPSGEPPAKCAQRANEWLQSVDVPYTVAVTHKTWTRLLLCDLLGIPRDRYRDAFDIKIAGITVLIKKNNMWRIDAVNYGATSKRILL